MSPTTTRREQCLDELLERLEERGLPQGAWLFDIAQVRAVLHAADNVLRRL